MGLAFYRRGCTVPPRPSTVAGPSAFRPLLRSGGWAPFRRARPALEHHMSMSAAGSSSSLRKRITVGDDGEAAGIGS